MAADGASLPNYEGRSPVYHGKPEGAGSTGLTTGSRQSTRSPIEWVGSVYRGKHMLVVTAQQVGLDMLQHTRTRHRFLRLGGRERGEDLTVAHAIRSIDPPLVHCGGRRAIGAS